MNTSIENKSQPNKNWLQRLKDESWEAELLVSAIAIYGTSQLFSVIHWGTNFFIDVLNPSQYIIGYFIITIGLLAISILSSMFVIHFFLRAYWIGLVGLNSVFPDYSIEDSAYSKIYTKKILAILPKLKDSIQKVDELCSVIFSAAFTFLFIYAYLAVLASLYLLIYNILSEFVPTYILLIPLFFIGAIFVTQVLLSVIANLKPFKTNERIQTLSFKVVRISSIFLYGPVYKSVLQVTMIFGSNFKKKKSIVYLIFTFLIAGMFVMTQQISKTNILYLTSQDTYIDNTRMYAQYYETQNDENSFLLAPEIESDKIGSNFITVFIPIFKYEKQITKTICSDFIENINKSDLENRKDRWTRNLNCFSTYNTVFINDIPTSIEFLKYNHHRTKQSGIIGHIDISELKPGLHRIIVKKQFDERKNSSEWSIPFYKISN